MEEEMFNFFPNGIRVLLVDDDPKFLKSATMMLFLLQFKVATCSSPSSALRLLSGEKVKDVDVVLADAHQVAAGGFDLCAIVELDLGIPVIYFMSPENQDHAAAAAAEKSSLDRIVQSATFLIKKPLDAGELSTLWKVVAWRKCFLDARKAKACVNNDINDGATTQWMEDQRVHYKVVRAGGGGGRRNNNRQDSSDAGSSKTQKHRVMWTPCLKQKFEHAVKSIGIGGHPSEILHHMNVKGLRRHHVASYLQKYRATLQKKNNGKGNVMWNSSPCSDDDSPKESSFIQYSSFPTPNIPPHNSHISTGDGGSSTGAAAEDFTGENDATALRPSWHPPLFQEDSGNSVIDRTPAPAPVQTDDQQSSSITEACNVVASAFAGGDDAPALSAMVQQQQQLQGDSEIQPLYQQSMTDWIAGATAVAATTEANEAALTEAFVNNTRFVAPDHGASAAAEEQEAAAMASEEQEPMRTDEQQSSSITEAHNVAAMAFASGNDAPVLSSWPSSFQQPIRTVSSSSAVPVATPAGQQPSSVAEASNVAPVDFTGNVAPAVPQWPAMFQQPTEDVSSILTLAAAMQAEEQLSSGAGEGTLFPQMFFGSFDYQGPFPLNTFGVQGEVQQQQQLQGDAEIQPLYQQSMADQIAGAAVAATTEANEAALIEAFASNTQFVVPYHGASAAAEEQEAAAMVAEMLAAPENGPAVASDGDGDLGPMVIAADEGFTLDQLESLLGTPMDTDGAAAYESNGFLNGEEGGTGGWNLGTDQGSVFLEEIFGDNTGT